MLKTLHKRAKRNQIKRTLRLDVSAGTTIQAAAVQALRIARERQALVLFKFNHVLLRVVPQENSAEAIVNRHRAAIEPQRRAWEQSVAGRRASWRISLND